MNTALPKRSLQGLESLWGEAWLWSPSGLDLRFSRIPAQQLSAEARGCD
jgi:hypothetical protein